MAESAGLRTRERPRESMKADHKPVEKIPVLNHVTTDEAAGLLQGMKIKPMNLTRAAKLLTDPHSNNLFERHVHALNRIAKRYCNGFLMRDLVQVFKILNICADRIPQHLCYVEPLCGLLKICGLPFLKEKMSDERTYQQIVVESISQLGYLMRVPNALVRTSLADSLVSVYCDRVSFPSEQLEGLKGVRHEFNMAMVEKSDVSETLVKSLSLLADDLPMKITVLKVLLKLSSNSASNSSQMLASGAAVRVCCDMNSPDPSGMLLFVSVEILWNLLESGGEQATQQLCNRDCVSAMRDAFKQLTVSASSNYHRQLRNDLLVITTLLARSRKAPLVETGFAKELMVFATFSEVKSHNPLVKSLKLSQAHEDFELKKLLINMLEILGDDPAAFQLFVDCKVLLSLFHYVKANSDRKTAQEWSPAQFEELQLHAMSALTKLSVRLVDDYMSCQGNVRLLLLLEWCVSEEPFHGQGNAFHGTGGRGNKKAQMRQCLRLLRAVVSSNREPLMQDLCDQGFVSQLLQIVETFPDTDDAIDIEMQCDMLHILSTLCDQDIHRKELFGLQGVEVLVRYMRMSPARLSAGFGHHRLMLAAVDAVWCCAVGCFTTEDILLEKEGVFLLIDLLEKCPRSMHNVILGCLLELSENPKTIAHIHTWRGEADVTAPHLLIKLWRDQEDLIGTLRDHTGSIVDVDHPIAGYLQREHQVVAQPATAPSLAIVDVSENLRAKIYALFARLGFSDLPGLTTEDYVTLAIVEKYLDFKLGEVWKEIVAELPVEGVRPTTPDQEALDTIARATVERAKGVAMLQSELLDAERQQDLHDEKQLYVEMKDNHRQRERAAERWEDYVRRTSNYNNLRASKKQQNKSIESSRAKPQRHREPAQGGQQQPAGGAGRAKQPQPVFHETLIRNLQTTTFQGRHVAVESTPIQLTQGGAATPRHAQPQKTTG